MPSSYTLNNGIELIDTGEQSGTWGDTTNDNLSFIDTALDGQVTITASSAASSGSPNDLPITNGTASNGRNRLVEIYSGTNLGGTVYYQLTPNDAEKIIYIRNNLNTQDLIVFQGTYNASNDYLIPNGKTAVIFFNGTGSGAVAANVMSNAHFDALNIVGNAVVGGTLDVTSVATATTFEPDGDTAAGDNAAIGYTAAEGLILTGQGSTNDVTIKNDADADVLEIPTGTTNVTIAGNLGVGGTVTGTGTSVFASLDISGDIDVDGTTNLDVVDIDGAVDMASTLTVGGDISLTGATTISNTSGALTIDVATDIILDADQGNVYLADAGVNYGDLENSSSNFRVVSLIEDKDLILRGNDNGSFIDALTLDMSDAGKATFNNAVLVSGQILAHQTNKGVFEYNSNVTKIHSYGASSGTGQIQFLTGGGGGSADSLAMTIDDSQNVGIGTSSPSSQLHLAVASGAGSPTINLERTDTSVSSTNTIGNIIFTAGEDGSEETVAQISAVAEENFSSTSSATGLFFKTTAAGSTSSSEAMRISSAGDVGIGCSPASGVRLDIRSNATTTLGDFRNASATGFGLYVAAGDTSSQYAFRAADYQNNSLFSVMGDGSVGIGTSSPVIPIQINNYGGLDGNDNQLILSNNTYYSSGDKAVKSGFSTRIDLTNQDGSIRFLNTAASSSANAAITLSERMRIDSSGIVGIGVSDASTWSLGKALHIGVKENNLWGEADYAFHMNQNAYYNGGWKYTHTDEATRYSQEDGKHTWHYAASGTANAALTWSEAMRIDSSGRVGIGASPDTNVLLHVQGEIGTTNGTASDPTHTFYGDPNTGMFRAAVDALGFTTGGSERMRIDSSGAVVINNSGGDAQIYLGGTSGTSRMYLARSAADCFLWNVSDGDIRFGTNNTERMRINSQGNIGFFGDGGVQTIDHYSNYTTLTLSNSTGGIIQFEDDGALIGELFNGTNHLTIGSTASGSSLRLRSGAASEAMRIDSSGNVGIGCVPSSIQSGFDTLQIGGNLTLNVDSTGAGAGVYMGNNVYRDSGDSRWEYIYTDEASQYLQANGEHIWRYAGSGTANTAITWSEAMRITSGGYIEAASASQVRLTLGSQGTAGTNDANWLRGNGTSLGFNSASGGFQWEIAGSEKMRIASNGTLLVGRTTAVSGTTRLGLDATASIAGLVSETGPTSTVTHVRFYNGNGNIGNISTNGSATTYATSSDYRLKENVVGMTGATDRLKQLNPSRFNFIADADTTVDGFLAHEVQAVVPEAIIGTHNEVDGDGNPVYQNIDQSKLVPLLVATIKELEARITALEAN